MPFSIPRPPVLAGQSTGEPGLVFTPPNLVRLWRPWRDAELAVRPGIGHCP